jgi:hypothetical protein
MKIKFKNKHVHIKKLVQGAVVLDCEIGDDLPNIYHIHKFSCYNTCDETVDLVIIDDEGKWNRNSADLTWPI